tara:strand:+ start:9232 stop:10203 length:972 start_codon:yes stop_codon:yes gene_type:complete
MKNKKVCVIGGGRWGKNHLNTLNQLGSLYGLVEQNLDSIEYYKKIYPNIMYFTKVEDAINHGFDGYVVATPAETHYSIGKKIIESKNHLLIEKPITTNVQEAEELNNLANKNSVNLMVGHLLLFHPAIKKIKELIDSGTIGKLQYIYSNRLNLGNIRSQENVFWSFAPHDLSIIQYFTDSFPLKITSNGGAFIQKNIHDTTMTFLEYPNNVKSHIYVSWLHPFKEHRLVVIGSHGMLSYEDSSNDKLLKFYKKRYLMNQNNPIKDDGEINIIEFDKKQPLELELKYFIDHLDGSKVNISNGNNALEVVKILEDATNSLLNEGE